VYLHLGQEYLVPLAAVIAIFDISLLESSTSFRHMVSSLRAVGRVREISPGDGKSLVLLDDGLIISPISSATLRERARRTLWTDPPDLSGMV
jgi:hypothetical protein